MKIEGLIHEVAEAIRNLYQIGDTRVFEQDFDDVQQSLENVAKTLRCIIVGWNGCEHTASERARGDDPNALYVKAEIVVSVYENPRENRSYGGAPHLLGMAAEIAKAIDNAATEDMDDALHFVRITPIENLQHGVITCDVVFRTKKNL